VTAALLLASASGLQVVTRMVGGAFSDVHVAGRISSVTLRKLTMSHCRGCVDPGAYQALDTFLAARLSGKHWNILTVERHVVAHEYPVAATRLWTTVL
jgi:hypothetical protein